MTALPPLPRLRRSRRQLQLLRLKQRFGKLFQIALVATVPLHDLPELLNVVLPDAPYQPAALVFLLLFRLGIQRRRRVAQFVVEQGLLLLD